MIGALCDIMKADYICMLSWFWKQVKPWKSQTHVKTENTNAPVELRFSTDTEEERRKKWEYW